MQSSHAPTPRSAPGSRLGTAILLTLITMIVLIGLNVALWHYEAERLSSHSDEVLWGTYVGFGVITGLVLLVVRSSSPIAMIFAVIVVAVGSLADLFLVLVENYNRALGSAYFDGFEEVLQNADEIVQEMEGKVWGAMIAGVVVTLLLGLLSLVLGRSRARRATQPYRQGPLPYGAPQQFGQPQTPHGGPQPGGTDTPPPFQPQGGPQTPPPFPGGGLYSPPPYGRPPGPQQYGQPAGPASFGQQNPPPYDPEQPPRSPSEPPPYGQNPPQYDQQNPPQYGRQNPPPYGRNEPPPLPPREDAERDEPGPELPPLPPPPPPPR